MFRVYKCYNHVMIFQQSGKSVKYRKLNQMKYFLLHKPTVGILCGSSDSILQTRITAVKLMTRIIHTKIDINSGLVLVTGKIKKPEKNYHQQGKSYGQKNRKRFQNKEY